MKNNIKSLVSFDEKSGLNKIFTTGFDEEGNHYHLVRFSKKDKKELIEFKKVSSLGVFSKIIIEIDSENNVSIKEKDFDEGFLVTVKPFEKDGVRYIGEKENKGHFIITGGWLIEKVSFDLISIEKGFHKTKIKYLVKKNKEEQHEFSISF